jgi:hypothetical protein
VTSSTRRIEPAAKRTQRARAGRRRTLRIIAAGVLGAAVVGVGAWRIVASVTGPSSCRTRAVIYDRECVGVTDSASAFDPSLAPLVNKIARDNQNVEAAGDYVTVVLLTPLTTVPGSDVTLARIRQQMEGAYLAQESWNGPLPSSSGATVGNRPRIRLLLASDGDAGQAWPQVTRQIRQEPASANVVGVIGMGLSTTSTLQAARALATGSDSIPMIGTIDTADGLNSQGLSVAKVGSALAGPITNLTRVTPTVGDEISALHGYLRSTLGQAILVRDTDQYDLYTQTLATDFSEQFANNIASKVPYDTSAAVTNEFNTIAGDVCPSTAVKPPAILYAGRESLLPNLISQLRDLSTCPKRDTITVVTGSDAEALSATTETAPNQDGPQIKVVYANLIDTDELASSYKTSFTHLFGPTDLDASWAIMTYDAMSAAEQAARSAAGSSVTFLPPPSSIGSSLVDLHSIQGATVNRFRISADGDEQCQVVPVVIDSGGTTTITPPAHQAGCP